MYPMHSMWLWWYLWLAFFLLVVMMPVGYGWGYRGWGPPYPRYVQNRRMRRASAVGPSGRNHTAWGWRGDFLWLLLFLAMGWFVWLVAVRW